MGIITKWLLTRITTLDKLMKRITNFRTYFIEICTMCIISQVTFAGQSALETPMYDGTDSSFMGSAINSFGTSEHASEGYVEKGFDHYSNNKLGKSMQKFNQAWLLNPDNAYVYLGFGLLLNKNEDSCQAYKMFKLANKKGLKENGFIADYAYTSSQCAVLKEENEKLELFNASNTLYELAIQTPNQRLLAYVYHSWAKSYFLQEDFIKSQAMIEKSKALGGTIDDSLVHALNGKNSH
jgi:tetratricopeptide (TPR) repeat protein